MSAMLKWEEAGEGEERAYLAQWYGDSCFKVRLSSKAIDSAEKDYWAASWTHHAFSYAHTIHLCNMNEDGPEAAKSLCQQFADHLMLLILSRVPERISLEPGDVAPPNGVSEDFRAGFTLGHMRLRRRIGGFTADELKQSGII